MNGLKGYKLLPLILINSFLALAPVQGAELSRNLGTPDKVLIQRVNVVFSTLFRAKPNRLSSTIDGNVEFVHSQYSCILTSQVST